MFVFNFSDSDEDRVAEADEQPQQRVADMNIANEISPQSDPGTSSARQLPKKST